MNTPTHLLLGLMAAGKAGARKRNAAALAGAFFPDLALYALYAYERLILGRSDGEIFGRSYWSPLWQDLMAIGNSIPLALTMLALGLWRRWTLLTAFSVAALLHLLTDLPLHVQDAHRHFWPLTDWRFESGVSYWDARYHGDIVQPVELAFAITLAVFLWRRHHWWGLRAFVLVLAAGPLIADLYWSLVF